MSKHSCDTGVEGVLMVVALMVDRSCFEIAWPAAFLIGQLEQLRRPKNSHVKGRLKAEGWSRTTKREVKVD